MQIAQDWAHQRGDQQMGLQVFTKAQPALSLYKKLGYKPRALLLLKQVSSE